MRIVAGGPSDGGVAHNFSQTMDGLRRRGHAVAVVHIQSGGRVPALNGIWAAFSQRRAIAQADSVHLEFGSNDVQVFWFALAATVIRRDCVALIHDYPKFVNAPAAALVPQGSRIANAIAHRIVGPLLDQWVSNTLIPRLGTVLVLGDVARDGLASLGARDARRLWLGAHGLTRHAISPSQGSHVAFAGFIGHPKGVDVLFAAWSRITPHPELPLIIAGAPARGSEGWLAELVHRYSSLPNPPRVLGGVEQEEDLQRLIDQAAVVILPYRRSAPASGILIRAMRAGRPVVMTPVQATHGVIKAGANGILVPIGDPAALASAISSLLEDGAARDRMGAAAADTARTLFSWTRFVDEIETVHRAHERRNLPPTPRSE
jgi:glycosyltransferase involved in cell wall biosynthesis